MSHSHHPRQVPSVGAVDAIKKRAGRMILDPMKSALQYPNFEDLFYSFHFIVMNKRLST